MRDRETIKNEYERWLRQPGLAAELQADLTGKTDEEIFDRFYKDLEFGTGGLRGVMGAGPNRMNIFTVRKATQGIANYLNGRASQTACPRVAVGYDSRNNSGLFARTAADTLLACGIDVWLYDTLYPVPALSFITRYLDCDMGIMITASHNPAKYNGYKVYCREGYQITDEAADIVLAQMNATDMFDGPFGAVNGRTGQGTLYSMGREMKEVYLDTVYAQRMMDGSREIDCSDLNVVYTPLNGSGNLPVREMMERLGVGTVHIVKEQELPDGGFPTCPYPNPEKPEALKLAVSLTHRLGIEARRVLEQDPERAKAYLLPDAAQREAAGQRLRPKEKYKFLPGWPDLIIGTDPDCDRVGVVLPRTYLTGNEIGILMLDFICQMRIKSGTMPEKPFCVRTIVTSKMADAIAAHYGVQVRVTLTGFKYIGEIIAELADEDRAAGLPQGTPGYPVENSRESRYILGFEESYGYLSGTHTRDKDGVNAVMLILQMAAYYKAQGKTLKDRLEELYAQYGWHKAALAEFAFEGAAGMEKMEKIMDSLREAGNDNIAGRRVTESADYRAGTRYRRGDSSRCDLAAGVVPTGLPRSNVLEYVFEDGSGFIARPSGTEPKLKLYLFAAGVTEQESLQTIEAIKRSVTARIEGI